MTLIRGKLPGWYDCLGSSPTRMLTMKLRTGPLHLQQVSNATAELFTRLSEKLTPADAMRRTLIRAQRGKELYTRGRPKPSVSMRQPGNTAKSMADYHFEAHCHCSPTYFERSP